MLNAFTVCFFPLSSNKETASDENAASLGSGESLHYSSPRRGAELPITCLPPLAHTAPQPPAQPHFCKPLRAPPRWLFKGHPRVIRSVKRKYLSPEAILFLPSFLVSLFLCLFSLLPCSSVRTQNSSCQCLCRARSQGGVASPPALRLRYRLRVAERAPDSRDQRGKNVP